MIKAQTLKGFRDFLPKEILKREFVINILKQVFKSFGFEQLETPSLEYEEILIGKYGDEGDKLMYRFEDNGKRRVALRYDQTVPLARVISQYANVLPIPFKRYQIQNVFRAENTQKGRYREFLQIDADIVGTYSPLADAEIITIVIKSLEKLGLSKFKILINDRALFSNLPQRGITEKEIPIFVRAIDKLKKIGKEKVLEELIQNGIPSERATYMLQTIEFEKPTARINEITNTLEVMGIKKNLIEFMPTLVRGLDYYTGLIFEVEVDGYSVGSIAGGGRYDNLIGLFTGRDIPAVGFSFGFDRLIEAMDYLGLFPDTFYSTKVLVAFASPDLQKKALKLTDEIRNKEINSEVYPEDTSLEKQLKYADKKGIPYVIIVEEKNLILKDMEKRTQENLPLEEIINKLQ
jgi:histidyl-tRNA synthetase